MGVKNEISALELPAVIEKAIARSSRVRGVTEGAWFDGYYFRHHKTTHPREHAAVPWGYVPEPFRLHCRKHESPLYTYTVTDADAPVRPTRSPVEMYSERCVFDPHEYRIWLGQCDDCKTIYWNLSTYR